MEPTSNTDFESAPHSELADTPQSSTVIRVFLVDAILLVLILCWHIGIRSGILNFSIPLRVLLVVLWGGAICVAFRYGILPFRGRSMPKRQFYAVGVGLSVGIVIILMLLFGSVIPTTAYGCTAVGIGLAVSCFSLPRWQDKRSVVLAGAFYLMCALFGMGFGMVLELVPDVPI
jgi:hypothetical protein